MRYHAVPCGTLRGAGRGKLFGKRYRDGTPPVSFLRRVSLPGLAEIASPGGGGRGGIAMFFDILGRKFGATVWEIISKIYDIAFTPIKKFA